MSEQDDREAWTKYVTKEQMAKSIPTKSRSKYGAVKTESRGQKFDSGREAKRGLELAMLQASKQISDLQRQVPFDCFVARSRGELVSIGKWIADFVYCDRAGQRIVEDCKGCKTPLYRWKKKHIEVQYGIRILET